MTMDSAESPFDDNSFDPFRQDANDVSADPNGELLDQLVGWIDGQIDRQKAIEEVRRDHPKEAEDVLQILEATAYLQVADPLTSPMTPNSKFDNYHILKEIGRGGQGVVYRAFDPKLERDVAFKVLMKRKNGAWSQKQIDQFSKEARAAASLHHPNIVPVFGYGEGMIDNDEIPYYTMQLIKGASLKEIIATKGELVEKQERPVEILKALTGKRQADSWKRFAEIGCKVATALEYAHNQLASCHGDITPGNILFDERLEVYVADFGLARQIDANANGVRGGTPAYMAPELKETHIYDYDKRCDVYGLGASLYELVSLEKPEVIVSSKTRKQKFSLRKSLKSRYNNIKSTATVNPLRSWRACQGIPIDLEAIIMRALAYNPEHRYQTLGSMATDLQNFLNMQALENASRFKRARLKIRRNRLLFLVLAIAFLLMVGAILFLVMALHNRGIANAAIREKNSQILTSSYKETLKEIQLLRQARPVGWLKEANEKLRLIAKMEVPDGVRDIGILRHETIACLLQPGIVLEPIQPKAIDGPVWSVDFDGDGSRLVTADHNGGVSVFDPTGVRPTASIVTGSIAKFEAFHSQATRPVARILPGHRLALVTPSGRIELRRDVPEGPILGSIGRDAPVRGMSFDAKGLRMAVGWADGLVRVYDLDPSGGVGTVRLERSLGERGNEKGRLVRPHEFTRAPELSSDGRFVAVVRRSDDVHHRDEVEILNVGTSDSVIVLRPPDNELGGPVFSPDGGTLAVGGIDSIYVFDVESGRMNLDLRGHSEEPLGLAFDPAGRLLASVGIDATLRIWDLSTGEAILAMDSRAGSLYSVAFDPGGLRVAVGGERDVAVYRLTNLQSKSRRAPALAGVFGLALHPKKPILALGIDDGNVVIEQLDRSIGQTTYPAYQSAYQSAVYRLAFSPDGARLAVGPSTVPGRPVRRASGEMEMPELPSAERSEIKILDLDKGEFFQSISGHRGDVTSLAFSGNGLRLASATADGTVIVTDLASKKINKELYINKFLSGDWVIGPQSAFLDAGGHRLIVAQPSGRIGIANIDARTVPAFDHCVQRGVFRIAVSPTSNRLVVSRYDGSLELRQLPSLESEGTLTSLHDFAVTSMSFSRDGKLFATGDIAGKVVLWETGTFEPIFSQDVRGRQVNDLAFDSSGTRLIFADNKGEVEIWDLGKVQPTLKEFGLSWSGSGTARVKTSLPASGLTRRGMGPIWLQIPPRVFEQILRNCLAADPMQTEVKNELAWLLAAGPLSLRDENNAQYALRLARENTRDLPDDPIAHSTLIAAIYNAAETRRRGAGDKIDQSTAQLYEEIVVDPFQGKRSINDVQSGENLNRIENHQVAGAFNTLYRALALSRRADVTTERALAETLHKYAQQAFASARIHAGRLKEDGLAMKLQYSDLERLFTEANERFGSLAVPKIDSLGSPSKPDRQ